MLFPRMKGNGNRVTPYTHTHTWTHTHTHTHQKETLYNILPAGMEGVAAGRNPPGPEVRAPAVARRGTVLGAGDG